MTNENNTSKFIAATVKTVTKADRTHAVLSIFGADTRTGVDKPTLIAIGIIANFERKNLAVTFKARTGFDMPAVKVAQAKKAALSTSAGRMK